MKSLKTSDHGRGFAFSLSGMKRNPSLIPMVAIMGVAAAGCTAYCVYALATKKDVIVNRSESLPPWERVDLEHPKAEKFITINQQYHPNKQLIESKKAIN